jgi:tetratricopeptide (TPR) repeat protein
VKLDPGNATLYYNLGNVLRDQSRPDQASACFTAALRCDPEYVLAYNNHGLTLETLGRIDEARSAYETAITLDENCAEAHNRDSRLSCSPKGSFGPPDTGAKTTGLWPDGGSVGRKWPMKAVWHPTLLGE